MMSGKGKVGIVVVSLLLLSLLLPGLQPGSVIQGEKKKDGSPIKEGFLRPNPKPTLSSVGNHLKNGSPATRGEVDHWGYSIFKVGGTTLLVLVVAGACIFGISRLQRPMGRKSVERAMRVVESLPVGSRKRLHLARVGERVLLLAETEKELSLLLNWEEEEALPEKQEPQMSPEPTSLVPPQISFKRIFKARAGEE